MTTTSRSYLIMGRCSTRTRAWTRSCWRAMGASLIQPTRQAHPPARVWPRRCAFLRPQACRVRARSHGRPPRSSLMTTLSPVERSSIAPPAQPGDVAVRRGPSPPERLAGIHSEACNDQHDPADQHAPADPPRDGDDVPEQVVHELPGHVAGEPGVVRHVLREGGRRDVGRSMLRTDRFVPPWVWRTKESYSTVPPLDNY